jgi:DNA-binding Lrp family transcriptional regulator
MAGYGFYPNHDARSLDQIDRDIHNYVSAHDGINIKTLAKAIHRSYGSIYWRCHDLVRRGVLSIEYRKLKNSAKETVLHTACAASDIILYSY